MKRFVALILAVFLIVPICFAEEDYIQISDGVYEEGVNIDAGLYTFSCESTDMEHCLVATFTDYDEYMAFEDSGNSLDGLKNHADTYAMIETGKSRDILISDGYLLLVKFGSGVLYFKEDIQIKEKQVSSNDAYEEFLSILRSTEFTSGEKLMARIRYWTSQNGSLNGAINTYKASMLSRGFSSSETDEILIKAQFGEEIHPFHKVEDYSVYNSPAEENGLGDDTIFIDGVIRKYVEDGNKKNRVYGMIVEQEDGSQWLVSCAQMLNGEFVGKLRGSDPEVHVFSGYNDKSVRIYGEYLGFSEMYKLPTINIVTYGGMVLTDENTLLMTMTAEHNLGSYARIGDFAFLVGAEKTVTSTEHYSGR